MSAAADVPRAVADLSYSRLESWEKCPAAFWHAYVNRTPPDGYERVEAWTGSLVHTVLEDALRETLQKRVPDPVAVLQNFEARWDATSGDHVRVVRDGVTLDTYRQRGLQWLRDYLDDAWPFVRDGEPLHAEEPVNYPVTLPEGQVVQFRGVIDRVDRLPDGRLRVMDYKTGSWVPDFASPRDAFQLALYWPGIVGRYPGTTGGVLTWHFLQHRRSRHVDPEPTLLAAAQQWLRTTAAEILVRMEAPGRDEQKFPARPSILCKWCSFGYACEENPYRASAPAPRA